MDKKADKAEKAEGNMGAPKSKEGQAQGDGGLFAFGVRERECSVKDAANADATGSCFSAGLLRRMYEAALNDAKSTGVRLPAVPHAWTPALLHARLRKHLGRLPEYMWGEPHERYPITLSFLRAKLTDEMADSFRPQLSSAPRYLLAPDQIDRAVRNEASALILDGSFAYLGAHEASASFVKTRLEQRIADLDAKTRWVGMVMNTSVPRDDVKLARDRGAHWVALLVDRQARVVEYFDPFGAPPATLAPFVAHLAERMSAKDKTEYKVVSAVGAHQQGAYECGVYMIWFFVVRLVRGASLAKIDARPTHDKAMTALRAHFFRLVDISAFLENYATMTEDQLYVALKRWRAVEAAKRKQLRLAEERHALHQQHERRYRGLLALAEYDEKDSSDKLLKRARAEAAEAAADLKHSLPELKMLLTEPDAFFFQAWPRERLLALLRPVWQERRRRRKRADPEDTDTEGEDNDDDDHKDAQAKTAEEDGDDDDDGKQQDEGRRVRHAIEDANLRVAELTRLKLLVDARDEPLARDVHVLEKAVRLLQNRFRLAWRDIQDAYLLNQRAALFRALLRLDSR